jgi:2-polyprenyl-3-methyl-5-hydroxy-6-metoxy-1,4-benzoquinol methylase
MDTTYEDLYFGLQDTHWWFQARTHFILRLLRKLRVPASAAILDVGCSSGLLMRKLQQSGYMNVSGLDLSEEAVRRCHAVGLSKATVMDATHPQYADQSFDLLIASDILEHLDDESTALRHWLRMLKPGGQLIVCVPAFGFLWSEHDAVNYHRRRYTRKMLRTALARVGFAIDRASYWNFSLFLPVAAYRVIQRVVALPESRMNGHLRPGRPFVNTALYALLKVENHVLASFCLCPFGLSSFAIARRGTRESPGSSLPR